MWFSVFLDSVRGSCSLAAARISNAIFSLISVRRLSIVALCILYMSNVGMAAEDTVTSAFSSEDISKAFHSGWVFGSVSTGLVTSLGMLCVWLLVRRPNDKA